VRPRPCKFFFYKTRARYRAAARRLRNTDLGYCQFEIEVKQTEREAHYEFQLSYVLRCRITELNYHIDLPNHVCLVCVCVYSVFVLSCVYV
jgi:hypothetical protein